MSNRDLLSNVEVRRQLRRRGLDIDALLRRKLHEIQQHENAAPSTKGSVKSLPTAYPAGHVIERTKKSVLTEGSAELENRRREHLSAMINRSEARKKSTKRRYVKNESRAGKKSKTTKEKYEVEKLLDVKTTKDGLIVMRKFLVRWLGYGPKDDEWVDEQDLTQQYYLYNCHEQVLAKMKSVLESH